MSLSYSYSPASLRILRKFDRTYPVAVATGLYPDCPIAHSDFRLSSRHSWAWFPYTDHAVWYFVTEADAKEFEALVRALKWAKMSPKENS